MPLLLLIVTISFVFIAFISNQPHGKVLNPFLTYSSYEIDFILHHYLVFVFGFIVVTLFFIRSLHFDKKYSIYGNYLLPSIPRFLVVTIKQPRSHIMLIDNTLIITEIDPIELQKISPVIGYLFVKHYFPIRRIRTYPKIAIMSRQEYLTYRKGD